MSCPDPLLNNSLQQENKKETIQEESSEPNHSFSRDSVLGFLNNLISICCSILEDAEELLQQCYQDKEALLDLLHLKPKTTVLEFLEKTLTDWHLKTKEQEAFKRILDLTKNSKMIGVLKFLLTIKKEFTPLFITGGSSFAELQSCYAKIDEFQAFLQTKVPDFSAEIDELFLKLEENEELLKSTDAFTMIDIDDIDCATQATSEFTQNLDEFCSDVKKRLINNMMNVIDDEARVLGLCPPYQPNVANRGSLLLVEYSKDLELKKKLDYMAPKTQLTAELERIDREFQGGVECAAVVNKMLGRLQRVSYLYQHFDRRIYFYSGFCAGDSKNWCLEKLDDNNRTLPPTPQPTHFTSRKDIHAQSVTNKIYLLQMSFGLIINKSADKSICLHYITGDVSNYKNAKQFCIETLEKMRAAAQLEKGATMSFEVRLSSSTSETRAHQISFCCFYLDEKEVWRVRDLNFGEFEGEFSTLKEDFSEFYALSVYTTSLKYNCVTLARTMKVSEKFVESSHDEQYRQEILKNITICMKYELLSDRLLDELLVISQKILYPTTRDTACYYILLFAKNYNEAMYHSPAKTAKELTLVLERYPNTNSAELNSVRTFLQIARVISLIRSGQSENIEASISEILSSMDPQLLAAEDLMLVDNLMKQLTAILPDPTINPEVKSAEEKARMDYINMFQEKSETITSIKDELETMDLHSKSVLKKLELLHKIYIVKLITVLSDNSSIFVHSLQFQQTGSQEDELPPQIVQAMDEMLIELNKADVLVTKPQALTIQWEQQRTNADRPEPKLSSKLRNTCIFE